MRRKATFENKRRRGQIQNPGARKRSRIYAAWTTCLVSYVSDGDSSSDTEKRGTPANLPRQSASNRNPSFAARFHCCSGKCERRVTLQQRRGEDAAAVWQTGPLRGSEVERVSGGSAGQAWWSADSEEEGGLGGGRSERGSGYLGRHRAPPGFY